jgi:Cof subfamily protein (haloacid dehalogenase superfamily)
VKLPRLVALDLDGTLLRTDGTVSERTRRALTQVAAAGVELVVVTARPPRFVRPVASQLDVGAVSGSMALCSIALCSNGAIEFDLGTGTWQAVRPLPLATARRTVAALSGPGVGFAVETGDRVVHEPGFPTGDGADVRLAVSDLEQMWVVGRPIVKLLARSVTLGADDLLAAAVAALGHEVECTHSGGRGLLEISASGVSKVAGLVRLCERRGITAQQVMAFGDAPNDLAMLRWASTGYAVANAHPAVLASVARHTAANDEDGVAIVLERLLATGSA